MTSAEEQYAALARSGDARTPLGATAAYDEPGPQPVGFDIVARRGERVGDPPPCFYGSPAIANAVANRLALVRVLLGEFDPVQAHGLVRILSRAPGVCVLATGLATGGLEDASAGNRAEVAIVNEAVRPLRAQSSQVGVVVLARKPARCYGMVMLEAGVSCLADSTTEADLLAAVRLSAAGGCLLVCEDGYRLERRDSDREAILSDRESQVLASVSMGLSPKSIAESLGISAVTVRTHTSSLVRKLHARSRSELVGAPVPWIKARI
jgi:DNA-binding NarL/FixJ family response regulator